MGWRLISKKGYNFVQKMCGLKVKGYAMDLRINFHINKFPHRLYTYIVI